MRLIIDGYNLLHVTRSLLKLDPIQLQLERNQLVDQLSTYRQARPLDITIVFDGWQSGWRTEGREWKKGVEVIFSKLGEKADEVIKRLVREEGAGAAVVNSDRDIVKHAERLNVPVISSEEFRERLERMTFEASIEKDDEDEDMEAGMKRKGPSRMLSKKEKRKRAALKKL